jgi:glycosyltransferase involved in cell wall biosynthesis
VTAGTPLRIVGNPYSDRDSYAVRFKSFVREHPEVLSYQSAISNRHELARLYQQTRGFVLLSTMESLSLSALEAAASGCPLLLADLPWAKSAFGDTASYCPADASDERIATHLKEFYQKASCAKAPPKPLAWDEIAKDLVLLYEALLKTD